MANAPISRGYTGCPQDADEGPPGRSGRSAGGSRRGEAAGKLPRIPSASPTTSPSSVITHSNPSGDRATPMGYHEVDH